MNEEVKSQAWQDRAALKCGESSIDETRLTLPVKETVKDHHTLLIPALAALHILCDVRATKAQNIFFRKENEQTKGEIIAELGAWRDIQRLIENLIPEEGKGYFNDTRRRCIDSNR